MNTLYVNKDIPSQYHYARFGSNYIDLFDRPSAQNVTLNYYRIYTNIDPDFYIQYQENFGNYYTTTFVDITRTDSIMSRSDIDKIFICVFIAIFGMILTINLFTSFFKKGGLLGGLF